MKKMELIKKEKIIREIKKGIEKLSYVNAMWLEGSNAMKIDDKYSDLDIWINVDKEFEDKLVEKLKNILCALSKIDFEYILLDHANPDIRQMFFHLKESSEFLILDICIKNSKEELLTEGNKDEIVQKVFDKKGLFRVKKLNTEERKNKINVKCSKFLKEAYLYDIGVKKEILRGNFLEAIYYYWVLLDDLVGLLRLKHEPTKTVFGLKHIKRDLPRKELEKLEGLYRINDLEELGVNLVKVNNWIKALAKNLNS